MIRSVVLFVLCGGLLTSQSKAQDTSTGGRSATPPANDGGLRKMYEDIEIMRRLLQGKLENHYSARAMGMGSMGMTEGMGGMGMTVAGMPGEMAGDGGSADMMLTTGLGMFQALTISIDGVYLSDHGIVFTVAFSERPASGSQPYPSGNLNANACLKCHVADKEQISQKFSDVIEQPEAVDGMGKNSPRRLGHQRREPRNLFDDFGDGRLPAGHNFRVNLDGLGENGRHFSELRPEERVTVSITLGKAARNPAATSFGSAMDSGMPAMGLQPGTSDSVYGEETLNPATGSSSGGTFPPTEGVGSGYGDMVSPLGTSGSETYAKEFQAAYRDYLLLGDLHMKQNKPAQALEAYEGALKALANPEELTAEKLQGASTKTRRTILDLHHKLTQAALASEQPELARSWIERLILLQKGATSKTPPEEQANRLALPTKLILSAEKSLLDQVGSEITLQDFKTRGQGRTLVSQGLERNESIMRHLPAADDLREDAAIKPGTGLL